MYRIRLLFFICFCALFQGKTQSISPVFTNIVEELPSPEVYAMFQDSLGYMWFATDNGICKYDGKTFYEIDTDSYTYTPVIFNFFKESDRKVWISTIKNRLYWFDPLENKPVFHEYEFNDIIEESLSRNNGPRYIRKIYFLRDEGIKITFLKKSGYLKIDKKGKEEYNFSVEYDEFYPIGTLSLKIGINHVFTEVISHQDIFNQDIQIITSDEDTFRIECDLTSLNYSYGVSDYVKNKEETILLLSNNLIRVGRNNYSHAVMPSVGLSVLIFEDQILVGSYGGVRVYDSNLNLNSTFLDSYAISSILPGNDGEIWFSTLQNGVYYSNNIGLKKIGIPNGITISRLFASKRNLKISDNVNKNLWVLSQDYQNLDSIRETYFFRDVFRSRNKKYKSMNHDVKRLGCTSADDDGDYYVLNPDENEKSQYLIGNNLFLRKDSLIETKFGSEHVCNDCFRLNDSTLLIGTENGLYEYHFGSIIHQEVLIPNSENLRITGIYEYQRLIIASSQRGLFLFENNNLTPIFLKENETFGKVNGIHFYANSEPYIFGKKGVFKLEKSVSEKGRYKFVELNFLPPEEVISMSSNEENLFFGTRRNVYVIGLKDIDLLKNDLSNPFILDSILINNQRFNHENAIELHEHDVLSLFFKSISFRTSNNEVFEYQLNNNVWLETNGNNLTLRGLEYGNSMLKIRSSKSPEEILFEREIIVNLPFYKRNWFILASIVVVLTLFYFLFKIILKISDKRKELKIRQISLELKLLTSQMNPHFTFNSINSIQYYILKNNKDEAIKYLSDFAVLIRKTLDFSMNDLISIRDELKFLDLYVKLENRRFDTLYVVNHMIESTDIYEKKIPSFMLQPLIENVINHAYLETQPQKEILVKINYTEKFFFIKVIDFGRGNKSKFSEDNKHKSHGLNILRNRIKIYNGSSYQENDLSIVTTDLENNIGKTVTIKLKEWT